MALEGVGERPQHHVDSLGDRVHLARRPRVLDGPVEIVDDRQQVAQQALVREPQRLRLLARLAPLEVLELGALAQQTVLQLGDLRPQPVDVGLRRLGGRACAGAIRAIVSRSSAASSNFGRAASSSAIQSCSFH